MSASSRGFYPEGGISRGQRRFVVSVFTSETNAREAALWLVPELRALTGGASLGCLIERLPGGIARLWTIPCGEGAFRGIVAWPSLAGAGRPGPIFAAALEGVVPEGAAVLVLALATEAAALAQLRLEVFEQVPLQVTLGDDEMAAASAYLWTLSQASPSNCFSTTSR